MSGRRQLMMAGGGGAIPIEGVRGVWWYASSGGPVVSSAMAISGGTVGPFSHGGRGGLMQVYSGGVAESQTVVSGGWVYVENGGVATGGIMYRAQMRVAKGGSASDFVLNGTVYISGALDDATMQRGILYITSSGHVGNLDCQTGNVYVRGHADVSLVTISGAGAMHVSGGVVTDATISSGGMMYVSSGGVANEPIVVNGGTVAVYDGGVVSGGELTELGALMRVSNGGVAYDVVTSSYNLVVHNGGILVRPMTRGIGQVHAHLGGTIQDLIMSGGVCSCISGTVSGATVSSGHVRCSSYCENVNLLSHGSMTVITEAGRASNTTVFSGGILTVSSGGLADSAVVSSDGRMTVSSGGVAVGASALHAIIDVYGELSGGYVASGTSNAGNGIYIRSGGMASGVVVDNLGSTYVEGVASDVTVSSGGLLLVSSGGAAFDVTSMTGATVIVAEGGTITYKEEI